MTYSIDFNGLINEECSDVDMGSKVLVNMYQYNNAVLFEDDADKLREVICFFAENNITLYMYNLNEEKKGKFRNYRNVKFID